MPSGPQPEPKFRRPTRDDAAVTAREMFDAGERIDVAAVARRLGVSRVTVHRWFGTRDQLLFAVFDDLAEEFVTAAATEAEGVGDERMLDFSRRIAAAAADFPPLRAIARGETTVALKLLLSSDGPVKPRLAVAVREMLAAGRSPAQMLALEPRIELYVDSAMALFWTGIATDEERDPERIALLGRALLTNPETATDDGLVGAPNHAAD